MTESYDYTTSEYDSSEYDSDSDLDSLNEYFYQPEEISNTKYNIVLCQLYNNYLFGMTEQSVKFHYLSLQRFKTLDIDFIDRYILIYKSILSSYLSKHTPISHPIFENYENIIQTHNYIQPEIAECIYLPTFECVAIKKTIWIKLIQKKWKKVMKERKQVLYNRALYSSLKYRETHGIWPKYCLHLPTIKGMLSNLC
jgi:hypothetical protein